MDHALGRFPVSVSIPVAWGEMDALQHVNNVVYLRWVQDAAIAHWMAAAPPEALASLFWVVTRHEIDYRRPALLGDGIIARTWVGPATRRDFERNTEILRAKDRVLLARARTLWCPMAVATGRPATVSQEVRSAFSVPDD